jgi:RNA polymerase sigma factor (sigma-70 family)
MTRAFVALQNEPRRIEMRPWLFRIAHNEAISVLRRRPPVDELDDLETHDAPVEEQVSLRADLRHLHQDLEALPERQRAALVLRELNGLSHDRTKGRRHHRGHGRCRRRNRRGPSSSSG